MTPAVIAVSLPTRSGVIPVVAMTNRRRGNGRRRDDALATIDVLLLLALVDAHWRVRSLPPLVPLLDAPADVDVAFGTSVALPANAAAPPRGLNDERGDIEDDGHAVAATAYPIASMMRRPLTPPATIAPPALPRPACLPPPHYRFVAPPVAPSPLLNVLIVVSPVRLDQRSLVRLPPVRLDRRRLRRLPAVRLDRRRLHSTTPVRLDQRRLRRLPAVRA